MTTYHKNNRYYKYERKYWNLEQTVLGLDEAGRGSWAGPIFVAGVILPINYQNDAIRDSKVLTKKQRAELYQVIIKNAIAYQISIIPAKEVDKKDPKHATIETMYNIINYFEPQPSVALIDAEKITHPSIKTVSIIKGDSQSISIAAASILAKVARDQYMEKMQNKYPAFSFAKHKGYGTILHLNELKQNGPIKNFHRYSYRPIKQILKDRAVLAK